jgi:glycosyltransferase involved in cell wall biosynthesis
MTNKKTVILQACVGTSSGYGARSRDIAWALIENENYDVKIISTPWGGTPQNFLNSSDPKHCKIIERVIQPTEQLQQPDVFIQITVPNEFQKVGTFKSIGITAGMETNLVDPSWLEGINRMDLTLCSSKHSAEVFKQNKYDKLDQNTKQKVGELLSEKEVDVLFEGIDFSIYHKTDALNKNIVDAMADIKESFCFLTVGHWLPGQMWEDRKNMGGTIWTFLDTFKNKINAPALVLKISCGVYSEIDKHEIQKRINSIKNSFEHTATRLPNVYLLHGDLTDEEMNSVYNHPKIKAMLSMTKGEGFGRPLAEFATTGKPIIVSAYSGHTDFLPAEMVMYIPGEMKNVHSSAAVPNMILEQAQWFMPNPAVAGRYMIDTFENYKSKLEVSRKLPKHLKDNFSYDKMKETLYKWIEAPIAAPKVPQPQQLKLPQLRKIELPQLKKDRIT